MAAMYLRIVPPRHLALQPSDHRLNCLTVFIAKRADVFDQPLCRRVEGVAEITKLLLLGWAVHHAGTAYARAWRKSARRSSLRSMSISSISAAVRRLCSSVPVRWSV